MVLRGGGSGTIHPLLTQAVGRHLMNKKEHDEAVASLKEICREIGCSGLSSAMCDHAPQKCGIIRKLVIPANKVLHPTPESGGTFPSVESNSENVLPAEGG